METIQPKLSITSKIVWLLVAVLGAVSFGILAISRGEHVNAVWLVLAAICVYSIAYRFYSLFIANKVFELNARRLTPAHRLADGLDYVPTNKYVLFGHHFAAIAGAGPLVGPILAAQMGYLVLALGLSTSIVSPLKTLTGVHCPWSLSEFGGTEMFTPLLAERAPTLKPGRCWPGGHASAGFSLLALYFVLRDRRPRLAHIALGVALALGTLMSAGRVMQGAHFASHNLWTLLFDWTICLACYRLLLYRRAATPAPGIVATATT